MDIKNAQTKYILGLSSFAKFGQSRLSRLDDFFETAEEAYKAALPELMAAKIEEAIAHEFIKYRTNLDLNQLLEQLHQEEINIITKNEAEYPVLLKQIFNPPFILYYRGKFPLKEQSLAVVGTRKHSPYGVQLVNHLIPPLVSSGLTITSGLALGIDSLIHNATLEAGGRTIGVLGSGIDRSSIYPRHNQQLADKIINNGGAIISEYPPKTEPLKYHFPMRNRIISGLSFGTLVIEAALDSGSLITARTALEQNREVFAVPGNIFSNMSRAPMHSSPKVRYR
ncbi:MAG: DNA-processing protein DprA [bacterium]